MNYIYKEIFNTEDFEAMLASPDAVPPPSSALELYVPTHDQARRYIWKAHTWYATSPTIKYNSNPHLWYPKYDRLAYNTVLIKYRRWLGLSDIKIKGFN